MNIIAPIDNFGLDNKGSWWIGVDGNKSTSNLLSLVVTNQIIKLKKMFLCVFTAQVWVVCMILNADRLNADAVYANVPQIRLLGSTYSKLGMKKYFQAALGEEPDEMYNDLNNYIRTVKRDYPLFYL